ncbi:MAG TPA: glutamate racemase [Cytophagaceae bacterium]|jgi:glutamate racemase|nr:glutamate racemase [Cytophagaceae bacterium]
MTNEKPIGIFDSGIGGLTVARAVKDLLPNENIIYFGDTAHLPYGDKSAAAIQSYTVKICDLLIKQQCKVILIACNSASSAAYQLAKEYVGSKAKVINVIDPVISFLSERFENKTIGLIGTKRTVRSNVYQKKLDKLNKNIQLRSLATPLLAPMIEEGYFDNTISEQIIQSYLSDPMLQGIEALVLGCTHYPLIKHQIAHYYHGSVEVIDSSHIVAEQLKVYLDKHNLHKPAGGTFNKFFVSDYTHSFAEATRIFFREEVNLEFYPLWE